MAPVLNSDGDLASPEQWTWEENLHEGPWLSGAAILLLIAAIVLAVLSGTIRSLLPAALILLAGLTALVLRTLSRTAVIIDRNKGIVNITAGGSLLRMRKSRPLGEFDRVAVRERNTALDAGYYVSQYTVMLLGGRESLALLTTADGREASALSEEVALFLQLPADGPDRAGKTAHERHA